MPVKLNSSGGGSVTLDVPATAGTFTATIPANTGTVVTTGSTAAVTQGMLAAGVAGNGPAFGAYQSSAQTLGAATNTKITFTTEDFDTNNLFTNSRFTPNVAGYYLFTCGVRTNNSIASFHAKLVKNGASEFAAGSFTNTNLSSFMSATTGIAYLNGTTDYVEVFVFSGSSVTLAADPSSTYFQGALVRAA